MQDIFKTKILLTRDAPENQHLAKQLDAIQIPYYSHPLLERQSLGFDWSQISGYLMLIITSKFAAQLAAKSLKHEVECAAVGCASAEILRQNPLIKIIYIANSANQLIQWLSKQKLSKAAYLSGNIITVEMPKFVDRYQIYHTKYAIALSNELQSMIKGMQIKAVVLYSRNSARIFLELCQNALLLDYLKDIKALTLSQKIGKDLSSYFAKVDCSHSLDNTIMLKLMENLYY